MLIEGMLIEGFDCMYVCMYVHMYHMEKPPKINNGPCGCTM